MAAPLLVSSTFSALFGSPSHEGVWLSGRCSTHCRNCSRLTGRNREGNDTRRHGHYCVYINGNSGWLRARSSLGDPKLVKHNSSAVSKDSERVEAIAPHPV